MKFRTIFMVMLFLGACDLLLTAFLLKHPSSELNPIARAIFENSGPQGLLFVGFLKGILLIWVYKNRKNSYEISVILPYATFFILYASMLGVGSWFRMVFLNDFLQTLIITFGAVFITKHSGIIDRISERNIYFRQTKSI